MINPDPSFRILTFNHFKLGQVKVHDVVFRIEHVVSDRRYGRLNGLTSLLVFRGWGDDHAFDLIQDLIGDDTRLALGDPYVSPLDDNSVRADAKRRRLIRRIFEKSCSNLDRHNFG